MAQRGYHYDPAIWHVVMCSIYSDYAEVAKKYGLSGNAEFFADWRTHGSTTKTPSRTRRQRTTAT